MHPNFWRGLFIVCVVMLGLLGASVAFADINDATLVVTVLAAIHLFFAMAVISGLLYFDWDPIQKIRGD